jgi:hypothetical protein
MSVYEFSTFDILHFRRYLSEIALMSVHEFLSIDIDTDIDAKTSISGGKDCRFGISYPISTFVYVDIDARRRY